MRPFCFGRAATLEEVLDFKARHRASGLLLAGGTDLIIELRGESPGLDPVEVLDISSVEDLKGIGLGRNGGAEKPQSEAKKSDPPEQGSSIRIGSLATHTEVAESELLGRTAPLLSAASAEVGSPQIRNRGTIGGNICNASPCADTVPALIALGAGLTLRSAERTRRVAMADFIKKPYQTVMEEDEVLDSIEFPSLPAVARSAFVKLGRRNALSISRMSVAVVLLEGPEGGLEEVRIAAGSVAPTVRRFGSAEKLLLGQKPSKESFTAAGEEVAAEMIRISGRRWSTPYKEPVVQALVRRALFRAMGWGDGGEK